MTSSMTVARLANAWHLHTPITHVCKFKKGRQSEKMVSVSKIRSLVHVYQKEISPRFVCVGCIEIPLMANWWLLVLFAALVPWQYSHATAPREEYAALACLTRHCDPRRSRILIRLRNVMSNYTGQAKSSNLTQVLTVLIVKLKCISNLHVQYLCITYHSRTLHQEVFMMCSCYCALDVPIQCRPCPSGEILFAAPPIAPHHWIVALSSQGQCHKRPDVIYIHWARSRAKTRLILSQIAPWLVWYEKGGSMPKYPQMLWVLLFSSCNLTKLLYCWLTLIRCHVLLVCWSMCTRSAMAPMSGEEKSHIHWHSAFGIWIQVLCSAFGE